MFLDLFFPKVCALCGITGWLCCPKCKRTLEKAKQRCPECNKLSLSGVVHRRCRRKSGIDGLGLVYKYKDPKVTRLISELKYHGVYRLAEDLVPRKRNIPKVDLITYIPLYSQRERWRGFNQAEVIARKLGKNCGIKVLNTLVRIKDTPPLAKISSAEERKQIVQKIFTVNQNVEIKDKAILITDDVFTSGATMKEAVKVLKRAGAKSVWGWALAG